MPREFCALQILKACNVAPQHLFNLLQPFDNQLPNNAEQFNALCRTLRRHGHIAERMPGNIASALNGPATQARAGAYMAMDNPMAQSPDQGTATFLSSPESGQAASPWDTLLPSALTSGNPFATWSDPNQVQSSSEYTPLPMTSQSFPVNLDTDDQDDDWEDATSSSATSSDEGDETIPAAYALDTSAMTDIEASEAPGRAHPPRRMLFNA